MASVAQMFVEETAFLETDNRAARVCQQSMPLGFEPAALQRMRLRSLDLTCSHSLGSMLLRRQLAMPCSPNL